MQVPNTTVIHKTEPLRYTPSLSSVDKQDWEVFVHSDIIKTNKKALRYLVDMFINIKF